MTDENKCPSCGRRLHEVAKGKWKCPGCDAEWEDQ